jgi:hypothetical protein
MARHEDEYDAYEDEDEALDALVNEAAEGPASKMGVDVTLLTAFSSQGFRSTPRFRSDWAKLSAAGRVGNSREFRKLFCAADHFEVARTVDGKRIWTKVVVAWGRPVLYSIQAGRKPLLGAIAPKGWHLSQVGRSVPSPRLPLCARP